jgi:hypothetical protein
LQGTERRVSDHDLARDDYRLSIRTNEESPDRCNYSKRSPLKNQKDGIVRFAYEKDDLASILLSMDKVGSGRSMCWNDSQRSIDGSIRVETSQHSSSLKEIAPALSPASTDSVDVLQLTVCATHPLLESSAIEEGKEATSDDEGTVDRTCARPADDRRYGSRRVPVEPVMEQIVRAVLEDKDAALSAPNCYMVLYRYAQAQVEIERHASEARLARLKIAKLQREADLWARLVVSSSFEAAAPIARSREATSEAEPRVSDATASPEQAVVEENESSHVSNFEESEKEQELSPSMESNDEGSTRPRAEPSAAIVSASTGSHEALSAIPAAKPTDPLSALLYELAWAVAFTLCLISNLHGPGAKRFARARNGPGEGRNNKSAAPPPRQRHPPPAALPSSSRSFGRSVPRRDPSASKIPPAAAAAPPDPALRRGAPRAGALRPALKRQPSGSS